MAASAAADKCQSKLAGAERCYRKKLDELNTRLMRQAAEREQLDQRRDACFQQLQYESCMLRNQLQACAFTALIMYACGVNIAERVGVIGISGGSRLEYQADRLFVGFRCCC